MGRFCKEAGQTISAEKSLIYFSSNVPILVQKELALASGFCHSNSFGTYLGVPILSGRLPKGFYKGIVEKMRSRLATWKTKTLSLAGRITLAQSVLNAMPVYQMQVLKLPKYICNDIDRVIRDFIWGSSSSERKVHWVAWNQVCKAKNNGGLGIRSSEKYNLALLAKLGWKILQDDQSVAWINVFKNKYFKNGLLNRIQNGNESNACKAILAGVEAFREGFIDQSDEEGTKIRWKWDNSGIFSVKSAFMSLLGDEGDESFKWELIWRLKCSQQIRVFVWRVVLNRIATMESLYKRNIVESGACAICGAEREDLIHVFLKCKIPMLIWDSLGLFSGSSGLDRVTGVDPGVAGGPGIRSMVAYLEQEAGADEADGRKELLQRDKEELEHFNSCWISSRDSLPRRPAALAREHQQLHGRADSAANITTASVLGARQQLCSNSAAAILAPSSSRHVKSWVEGHLQSKARINGLEWPYVYIAALWIIWTKRNAFIFNEETTIPHGSELKSKIFHLARNFISAWGKSFDGGLTKLASNVLVKWVKPSTGFKLNIDGSFFNEKKLAGFGGIIRDKYGTCISGFLGACLCISPFISELFALRFGLRWACNNGFTDLVIETDSEELHALVKGGGSSTHFEKDLGKFHALVKGGGNLGSRYVSVIEECCALLKEFPNIVLNHVFREANLCADKLAKEGARMSSQPITFKDPPEYLWKLITRDRSGYATARVVLA